MMRRWNDRSCCGIVGIALMLIAALCLLPSCDTGPKDDGSDETEQPAEPPPVFLSSELTYKADGNPRKGLIAYWSNTEARPALLLLPDSRGLDGWFRSQVDKYARMGYIVIVPDLTGLSEQSWDKDVVAELSASNAAAMQIVGPGPAVKTGVMGFGSGGTHALTAARYMNLDAVVICYGTLLAREEGLMEVEEPVLGIYGGSDERIPMTQIVAFQEAMQRVGGRFEGQVWQNEGHGFLRSPRDASAVREAEFAIVGWLDRYLLPPE